MPTIAIFYAYNNRRSKIVANAMKAGADKLGIKTDLLRSSSHRGRLTHEVAIFYGLADGLRNVFKDYSRKHRAVYIDLGYWGRRKLSRWDGYHKLSVNNRHPTAYFQNTRHESDRFDRFRIPIEPWNRNGRHIIVAGMSAKAAYAENLIPESWERETVAMLRKLTDRQIIYRPKPNWPGAKPIPGARMDGKSPVASALRGCHAVVTHHSNVAVDAVLAGVPVISMGGVASVMGSRDLRQIENLPTPDDRLQWASDIAWTQWNIDEMSDGLALRYLLDDGLI